METNEQITSYDELPEGYVLSPQQGNADQSGYDELPEGYTAHPPVSVGEDVTKSLLSASPTVAANLATPAAYSIPAYAAQAAIKGGEYVGRDIQNAYEYLTGKPITSETDFQRQSQDLMKYLGLQGTSPADYVPTPSNIANYVAKQAGMPEYQPQTAAGRMASSAASLASGIGKSGAPLLENALSTAGGTLFPEAVNQLGGGEQLQFITGLGGGLGGGAASQKITQTMRPLSSKVAEGILKQAPSDLSEKIALEKQQISQQPEETASQIAPTNTRTLAQIEPSLIDQQKNVFETQKKLAGNSFQDKLQNQSDLNNQAIQNFNKAEQSTDPQDVKQAIKSHLDALDQQSQSLQEASNLISNKLLPETSFEEAGTNLRSQIENKMAEQNDIVDKSYKLLDPYKKLPMKTSLIIDAANNAQNKIQQLSGGKTEPAEQHIYDTLGLWQDHPMAPNMSIGVVTDFSKNLNDAISSVIKSNGANSQPAKRLMSIKSAVNDAIANAGSDIHSHEIQQVKAGSLPQEQTLFNSFADQAKEWLNANNKQLGKTSLQAWRDNSSSYANDPRTTENAVSGNAGTVGSSENGFIGNEGNSRLQNGEIPIESGNAHSLFKNANKLYSDFKQTFSNPDIMDKILGKTGGKYDYEPAQVAEKFIKTGEDGARIIRESRAAGASDDTMAQIALNKLANSSVIDNNGNINVKSLIKWQRDHAPVLRELPSLDKILSNTSDLQAKMQSAVDMAKQAQKEAQQSSAAKILNYENPQDFIDKTINSSKDLQSDIKDMVSRVGENKQAVNGIRQMIINNFNEKLSKAAGNPEEISNIIDEINKKTKAISPLIDAKSITMMKRVAEDMKSEATLGTTGMASHVAKIKKNESIFSKLTKEMPDEGHAVEAGTAAVAAEKLAEHLPSFVKHHPIAATIGTGIAAFKILKNMGIKKEYDLRSDMFMNPTKYADVFQKVARDKPIPTLAQRVFINNLKKTKDKP